MCAKPPVFLAFLYILGGFEGLFDFYDTLHHHPWTGRPFPPIVGTPSSSRAANAVSSSF